MASTMTITPQEYIAWVQRSLNRNFGSALLTNGADTSDYRDKVRAFKTDRGLGTSGEVGSREQDLLIRESHAKRDYIKWAQAALNKLGAASGGAPTGILDPGTKTAIRSFQAYEGLGDDGWIGAKTETALIKQSGIEAPGHVTKPADKPEEIETSISVRGHVPRFIQRGPTCWAAAFAMMAAWKHGRSSIPDVLDEAGSVYTREYNRGHGLTEGQTAKLARILGLKGERGIPENWAGKLSAHGPLMVVQDPHVPGWLHWIVLVGYTKTFVFPDRSKDRESVSYNEPFSGAKTSMSVGAMNADIRSLTLTHYTWFHF